MEILLLVPGGESGLEPPLPAIELLGLLGHDVRRGAEGTPADAVLVDARPHPAHARSACRRMRAARLVVPLIAVVTEAGLGSVTSDWGLDDLVLAEAGPAELQARLALAGARAAAPRPIVAGRIRIDPHTFVATVGGRRLDLSYKEFELLRFLALHPGQAFTRERLLREVWGFDFIGGFRTVDMHVRRLRAKLGPGDEELISTIRQVGYRLAA
ncbi:response regulator transcription factor [Actinoplanes sp. NPDC026619]|uniref:winged helix-turn-helix transcriptional regulator n=1 Tax=Actinoplanes sp. NPDC026619 TaxID=3155798 RepID=UPI00340631D9